MRQPGEQWRAVALHLTDPANSLSKLGENLGIWVKMSVSSKSRENFENLQNFARTFGEDRKRLAKEEDVYGKLREYLEKIWGSSQIWHSRNHGLRSIISLVSMQAFVYNNVQSPDTALIHFAWHKLYMEYDKIGKANDVKISSDFGIGLHFFQDSES